MNNSWESSISQKRKGDPRTFINDPIVQNSLWASSDVYQRKTKTKKDTFGRIDSSIISPTDHVSKGLDALFGTDGFQVAIYRDDSDLNNNILIAFEGTNTASTLWKDIQLYQSEKSPFSPGKVHSGFLSLYLASKPFLESVISRYPGANITFTGHSLGGALASLAVADHWKVSSTRAVTFGAPQVGDEEFSISFQKSGKKLDRIVQKSDPIVVGNLNFNHMTEDAWVVGKDEWMSQTGHNISSYISSASRVNTDLSSLSTEEYIYPNAKLLLDAINTGKTIKKGIDYYNYAQELYQITQIASGLPQTTNTVKQLLFTDQGVLNRAYETTIDSLSKLETPTKSDFRNIFEERVVEVKNELERLDRSVTVTGPDLPPKPNSTLYGIEPDIGPKKLDEVIDSLKTKIPSPENPVDIPSNPKSNFTAIVKNQIQDFNTKYPIVQNSITNLKKAGNWIDKTLQPARSALGKLAGGLGVVSTLQHLTSKNLTASDIPELSLETINSALVVHEALSYAGVIQGIQTGSFIAGVSITSAALFASSIGLLSIAGYEILDKIKKGLYGDLGGNGVLNSMAGPRSRTPSPKMQILNDYLISVYNQASSLGIKVDEDFFEKNIALIEYRNGKIQMKDRHGELEDLLFPPIEGIHASSGELYKEYSLKKDVFDYLKSNDKLGEMTFLQFDAQNHGKFSIASDKILYDDKPFEDHFLPPIYLDGNQVLPSQDMDLYNNIQSLENALQNILDKKQMEQFISENAKNTTVTNDTIQIEGQDLRDVIMPPIEGVKFSSNAENYKKALLTLHLYQGLSEKDLVEQDFSDFFVKYFPSIHLDEEENILLENNEPAVSFPFLPELSPDGTYVYKIDDPELYNRIYAFNQHKEDLLTQINNMTRKKISEENLWNLYKDSILADDAGNLVFGMAPDEVSTVYGQIRIMDQMERIAEASDILLDNSFYKTRERLERSNIPLKIKLEDGKITLNDENIFKKFMFPHQTMDIPELPLYSVSGEWTKEIGVLESKVDTLDKEERIEQLSNFVNHDTPITNWKKKALEALFMEFLLDDKMEITEEEFYKIYEENTIYIDGKLVTKEGDSDIPPPIVRQDAQGLPVLQIQDSSLWKQLDFTHKIFEQLVDNDKLKEEARFDFIDQYKDRLGVSNGDFGDQEAGITLDGEYVGSYNVTDPNDPLLFSPLESMESKLASVSPDILQDDTQVNTPFNFPGCHGFKPTGEQLNVMLLKDKWYITYENSERDSFTKQRNLGGYTILGNWVGSSPLSNGAPTGILDSYFLAYHIQKRHNKDIAKDFLYERIQAALQKGTINATSDVHEFEVSTRTVDLPLTSDVFEIEKMQDTYACTLESCLQRNWNEVIDSARWGDPSLPTLLDQNKLALIPPFQKSQPLLKRTIEAAGILNDFAVQQKLRKVYGDFMQARKFSQKYMDLIQLANQGSIVPSMNRIEMEGRIARDDLQEQVSREIVSLLYTPLSEFFK